jgi:hypothetical protein
LVAEKGELGGAIGIGVLSSITLSCYRSRLAPALAGLPSRTAAAAKAGLAQALATDGTGADGPLSAAARHAHSSGLDLAMAVGACCLAAAAIGVCLTSGMPQTSGTLRDRAASEAQGPGAIPQEAGGRERSCA